MNTRERKPFRVAITGHDNQSVVTLQRPFIIHWPASTVKNPSKRHARKTFAVNFINDMILISAARCSKKDQFNKKIGRRVALGRLEKLTKEYFDSNLSLTGTFCLSNPYCRQVHVDSLESHKDGVFQHCSIPSDVVAYILDIYHRLAKQVSEPE